MGSLLSSSHNQENFKRNQEFISEMNRIKMDRWIQMHYQIKERELAMNLARNRELFIWLTAFWVTTIFGCASYYQRVKRITALTPIIPITFLTAYYGDLAYGTEADIIMQHEQDHLQWPGGLPTVSSIDEARVEVEMEKKMHPHHT